MKDKIFTSISDQICSAYVNLFLLAIENQKDLRALSLEIDARTNEFSKAKGDGYLPKGIDGVIFLNALAKAMGLSFFDVIYYSDEEQTQVVQHILEVMNTISYDVEDLIHDDESDKTYVEGLYTFDDENGQKICYIIRFCKISSGEKDPTYIIEVFLSEDGEKRGVCTAYMYDSAEIWSETEGFVADYIESIIAGIEKKQSEELLDNKDESQDDKHIGEILVDLRPDTKTIELMDEFDEKENDKYVYGRIIDLNGFHVCSRLGKYGFIYCFYVIEHGANGLEYASDITMTKLKQKKTRELEEYAESELSDVIISQYLDTDRFVRFKKPYRLRAQNSGNRIGYGWEWDWSGGYGDYVEGTQYGETTDYSIIGVYLSSDYDYDPDNRKPFVEKSTKLVSNGRVVGNIAIIPFTGKLSKEIRDKTESCYVRVETKYIAVAYDRHKGTGYVADHDFNKHKDVLSRWVEFIPLEEYLKKNGKPKAIISKSTSKRVIVATQPAVKEGICRKCSEITDIFRNGLCWDCYKYEMDAMFE